MFLYNSQQWGRQELETSHIEALNHRKLYDFLCDSLLSIWVLQFGRFKKGFQLRRALSECLLAKAHLSFRAVIQSTDMLFLFLEATFTTQMMKNKKCSH